MEFLMILLLILITNAAQTNNDNNCLDTDPPNQLCQSVLLLGYTFRHLCYNYYDLNTSQITSLGRQYLQQVLSPGNKSCHNYDPNTIMYGGLSANNSAIFTGCVSIVFLLYDNRNQCTEYFDFHKNNITEFGREILKFREDPNKSCVPSQDVPECAIEDGNNCSTLTSASSKMTSSTTQSTVTFTKTTTTTRVGITVAG